MLYIEYVDANGLHINVHPLKQCLDRVCLCAHNIQANLEVPLFDPFMVHDVANENLSISKRYHPTHSLKGL